MGFYNLARSPLRHGEEARRSQESYCSKSFVSFLGEAFCRLQCYERLLPFVLLDYLSGYF